MRKASASAVRGGTAGAVAMGANVAALMWMRTTVRATPPCPLLDWLCERFGQGTHTNGFVFQNVQNRPFAPLHHICVLSPTVRAN
jgi:hypothetical protein